MFSSRTRLWGAVAGVNHGVLAAREAAYGVGNGGRNAKRRGLDGRGPAVARRAFHNPYVVVDLDRRFDYLRSVSRPHRC